MFDGITLKAHARLRDTLAQDGSPARHTTSSLPARLEDTHCDPLRA
jgi:hypothetical protein